MTESEWLEGSLAEQYDEWQRYMNEKHPISLNQDDRETVCWREHNPGYVCILPEGHDKTPEALQRQVQRVVAQAFAEFQVAQKNNHEIDFYGITPLDFITDAVVVFITERDEAYNVPF